MLGGQLLMVICQVVEVCIASIKDGLDVRKGKQSVERQNINLVSFILPYPLYNEDSRWKC